MRTYHSELVQADVRTYWLRLFSPRMSPVLLCIKCPLWVISGHYEAREKESALVLKADMLSVGIDVR